MSDIESLIEAVCKGDEEAVSILLDFNPLLLNERNESGATPIHYATLNGHQEVVQLLIERGGNLNDVDYQFGATPTGWAIEYLRDMGGYLATELSDLAYAIQQEDVKWVARFLKRFPGLKNANDTNGKSFKQLAMETSSFEINRLFGLEY
jgi:ankyrin repeat protein